MALKEFNVNDPDPLPARAVWMGVALVLLLLFFLFLNPVKVIPAGHVGVKDLFGVVSPNGLSPGVQLVLPMTRVVVMSIQTQEIKETAEVPSQEGLIMDLEACIPAATCLPSVGPMACSYSSTPARGSFSTGSRLHCSPRASLTLGLCGSPSPGPGTPVLSEVRRVSDVESLIHRSRR